MTDITTKLAEALRQLVSAHELGVLMARSGLEPVREALAAYESAQAMSPKSVSGTSEPVAWRVWRGDSYELFFNEEAAKRRCECFIRQGKPEPLFAAPVAQAEPRKPLTESALCREVCEYGPQSEDEETGFRDGFRAAERVHGIGASTKESNQ